MVIWRTLLCAWVLSGCAVAGDWDASGPAPAQVDSGLMIDVDTDTNTDTDTGAGAQVIPNNSCATGNVWLTTTQAWLQTSPRIHLVFWGNYWLNLGLYEYDYYSLTWNQLANDPQLYLPLQQYGIGAGSLAGIFSSNLEMIAGSFSGPQIDWELKNEIRLGDLPLPQADGNDSYLLFLPPTSTDVDDANNNWLAHHTNDIINGVPFTYSVIEYTNDFTSHNISTSHEIYESATDPDGTGYHGSANEAEVADLCNRLPYWLDGYLIQQVWSEATCQCIPTGVNDE